MNNKKKKEIIINQKACVIWLTGLSGSGKTTLAEFLGKELYEMGFLVKLLDSDSIRSGLNKDLGFSFSDREENIRRVAELSRILLECKIICINSFISPTEKIRQMAKEIIGSNNFIEIFLNTPLEICEKRDVKGLYKKAREGKINLFTGIDSLYENPLHPDLEIDTWNLTVRESAKKCLEVILPRITP
jgi:adenylylsulfate kinase